MKRWEHIQSMLIIYALGLIVALLTIEPIALLCLADYWMLTIFFIIWDVDKYKLNEKW